jgi:hypothetical protein
MLCLSLCAGAQSPDTTRATALEAPAGEKTSVRNSLYYKNIIKTNLSSIALANYGLTYERMLTRKISASIGYRFMPSTNVTQTPLGETVMDIVAEEGDDISQQLDKLKMSGNAVTLEFRVYTGRRPGAKGFYAGVYGRYATFKYDYPYDFENPDGGNTLVPLKGNSKGIGGGIILGGQFMIAKRVVVDLFIIGGHYGRMTGKAEGLTDLSDLDEADRAELKDDIEGLVDLGDKHGIKAEVRDDGVRADIKLPFLGVRGLGLTVGFAF